MKKYYSKSWLEVVKDLNSNINKGLYEYECTIRRESESNKLNLGYSNKGYKDFLIIFKERYLYIYIMFIIFFLINKFYIMGISILILLLTNISIKIYIEKKSKNEMEILQNLNTSEVLVIREGVERLVKSEDLVKGDIVSFKKNSIIAADIRVIESENLRVDEKGITGDKLIKEKDSIKIDYTAEYTSDISNILFKGSVVKEGHGKGIVIEVGNNTQLGKLLNISNTKNNKKDILIKDIEINILKVIICLTLVQVIFILVFPGKLINKIELFSQGLFSIISIIFSFILIYYKKEMKKDILIKDNIEINKFSSLYLINNAKIFFMDKVGNLTRDEAYVNQIYTNEKIYLSKKLDVDDINIKRILDIAILCNNSIFNDERKIIKGNMIEIAYANLGMEYSIHKERLDRLNKRKFEIINTLNDIRTTLNKNKFGYRANLRGKTDNILECCTHILINGIERQITSEDIMKIKLADLEFSKKGLLTESFAYRNFKYEPSKYENIESNLVFVGIIALENPLYPGVEDDINRLIDNGILPIIFTEEDKIKEEVLGKRVGLISNSKQIVSGIELESLTKDEFINTVSKARIYCNVKPDIKNKIISLYSQDGYEFISEGKRLGDLSIIRYSNLGIVKGNISTILRKIGDIYTEKSSLRAFLELKNVDDNIVKSKEIGISIYTIIALSQIIYLNFQYLFKSSILYEEYYILLLNLFIVTPVILLNILCGNKSYKGKKGILRCCLFSVTSLASIYFIKDSYQVFYFLFIGGMSILDTLINCNVFNRYNLKYMKIFIITILFYITLLIGLVVFNSMEFTLTVVIKIVWILSIFIISDLIIKKW